MEKGEGRILLKTVSWDEKLYLGTFLLNYCEIMSKIRTNIVEYDLVM